MDRKQIIKGYLGPFLKKPSMKVRGALIGKTCEKNLYVNCRFRNFNEIITFLLLNKGRKNYSVVSSSELIDIFVGNSEDKTSIYEYGSPILFITVSLLEINNVRKWDIPTHLVQHRIHSRKPTVIITDYDEQWDSFKEMGFEFIRINRDHHKTKDLSDFDF